MWLLTDRTFSPTCFCASSSVMAATLIHCIFFCLVMQYRCHSSTMAYAHHACTSVVSDVGREALRLGLRMPPLLPMGLAGVVVVPRFFCGLLRDVRKVSSRHVDA